MVEVEWELEYWVAVVIGVVPKISDMSYRRSEGRQCRARVDLDCGDV